MLFAGTKSLAVWSAATEILEARVGIEPTHKGFADLSLTTCVPRLEQVILIQVGIDTPAIPNGGKSRPMNRIYRMTGAGDGT